MLVPLVQGTHLCRERRKDGEQEARAGRQAPSRRHAVRAGNEILPGWMCQSHSRYKQLFLARRRVISAASVRALKIYMYAAIVRA